jgi:ABC-type antimicrobial peptide transport system permease subunit
MTQQLNAEYRRVLLTNGGLSLPARSGVLSMIRVVCTGATVAVSQRAREIGIRVALGARTVDVLRLIVGEGLRLIAAGLLIGVLAAFAATKLMKSVLYGVSATDPLTFIVIAAGLLIAGLLACWIPARRAAKVDPLQALRYE